MLCYKNGVIYMVFELNKPFFGDLFYFIPMFLVYDRSRMARTDWDMRT